MNNYFGNNLKRLRLAKNYTQEQAAQMLNISAKSLSRWECGSTMPDVMILPEIARLYCVTVDDLYREQSIAYDNYAQRLMSVYESTRDIHDFINAEQEFAHLLKSNHYTINDICSYAILYQYFMQNCKDKALKLFRKGLDMDASADPDTYHRMERQRMLLLSQTGNNAANIAEQTENIKIHPNDFYANLNLLVAYIYANNNEKALEIFLSTKDKFANQPLLFAYGGDICKHLKRYEEAFFYWDKAYELDPEVTSPLWSKAFCYEELGNYQTAYHVWLEIIDWLETRGFEAELEEPHKRAQYCKERGAF